MNPHVPEAIQARWPSHEFIGRPFKSPRFKFTYIEAKHTAIEMPCYYVFEGDSFVCKDSIRCGAPELILEHPAPSMPVLQA
jgi:hypothetical protein